VRTTLAATAVVALALIVGGVGLVVVLYRSQVHNLESAAALRAADVVSLAESGPVPDPLPVKGDDASLVQIVDPSGRIVAASSNLLGQARIATFVPTDAKPVARTLDHVPIDDGPYRVVAMQAMTPDGPRVVYVASALGQARESVATLSRILAGGVPLLVGLVAITAWLVIGRALGSVERIRAEVEALSARDLGRRILEPQVDDEIGRLARTMNQMLDRLQSAADDQRRFLADASHELRSPLAALRTELEVAARSPGAIDAARVTREGLVEVARMEQLVTGLLLLARSDAPAGLGGDGVDLDLDDVVLAEVARASEAGGPEVALGSFVPARVRGDVDQLARALRNLLENATRHAEKRVDVELRRDGDAAVVVVVDDGAGIPAGRREWVFERFTRLDDARSRDAGGSGLGLAIVKEIVQAHGGTVVVADSAAGARLVVRLPMAPSVTPSP
jgi:signal transduction histidine kinase